MNSNQLEALVNRFIYQDSKSNFCIVLASDLSTGDEIVITSNLISVVTNKEYQFDGEYVKHPKYGHQFKAFQANIILPKQKDLVINFLSGPDFTGVGLVLAGKIVQEYDCEDIIDAILSHPERLMEIKGVTTKKAQSIIGAIEKHQNENGLFSYIKEFNVDYNDIIKVFNKANIEVSKFIDILKENPYLLMNHQIPFKDIDKFAAQILNDDYQKSRLSGFILEYLKKTTFRSGATYLLKEDIYNYLNHLDKETIEEALEYLENVKFVVVEDQLVYEKKQYDSETFIASFIKEYAKKEEQTNIDEYINSYESIHGIEFNSQQKEALYNGVNYPISIITGGPGTGKSTIVDALITTIKKLDQRLLIGLCAPTGKASKRLSDLTNEPAMTIHKMLKFDLHTQSFGHDIFNPIDYDILIVDESSMIDNILMASLLKASFNVSKIILLGDYNQLPSVSQGQVLRDLIESDSLKVTKLNQIYRQKEGSLIVDLAYKVLNNALITNHDFDGNEVCLVDNNNKEEVNKLINYYVNYENKNRIQILAPIYRGYYGIDYLNKKIQSTFFKDSNEQFNIGDRIIQLKNRNEDEIYNGDIGVALSIKPELIIDFESRAISYKKMEYIELKLAYCISIHKSQGNEYDDVVVFLGENDLSFVDQKILYTAITRAKKRLFIVSNLETLNNASNNLLYGMRNSNLKKRLNQE